MDRDSVSTRRTVARWQTVVLILGAVHIPGVASLGAEPVVAHLRNGRKLIGDVDSQTTTTRLWLRMTETNIVAFSSVPWRDVQRIEVQGRDFSVDDFRPEALRQKSDVPANVFVKPVAAGGETGADRRHSAAEVKRASPRVQALKIEAELANWDTYAATDGFELRIYPLGSDRSIVPVSGILSVELIGQNLTPDMMFEPIGENYSRLDRWSVRLGRDDFDGHEAVVQLPFRRIHPEFEVDVRNYGQLNASLNVNGQGVYDATAAVFLRRYSPLRERLQQFDRYRFFRGERTGYFATQHIGIFPGDVTGR